MASEQRLSIVHGPKLPPLRQVTLAQLLRDRVRDYGNEIALISHHQNESLTYNDLERRSDILADALFGFGIRKGDRVAVMLGSRSEYVDLLFACAKVGAYLTLLNYAYTQTELLGALLLTSTITAKETADMIDPKILFTTVASGRYDYTEPLAAIEKGCPSLEGVILLNSCASHARQQKTTFSSNFYSSYAKFLARSKGAGWRDLEKNIVPEDILNLQFTSGSSGAPKVTALTHLGMINSGSYIGDYLHLEREDCINIPLPLFHAFGLVIGLFAVFVQGASAVLPAEYFTPDKTLEAIEKYACTGLYGVTTMFISQMAHPNFERTKKSTLKFGIMAGSAMPEELVRRVTTSYPIADLRTNWGMTELSSIVTMTHSTDTNAQRFQSAGRILPNFDGKIVEPNTGKTLPWGARGEIVISGFGVMHSYYGDLLKTKETMKQHQEDLDSGQIGKNEKGELRVWLHTGDEGYLDDDGYFVITGRIKDLIIRGGENISPLEIEERLFAHPAIEQASVFGLADSRLGEVPAAILELKPNCKGRPRDEELKAWIKETLSYHKVPTRIWWLGDRKAGMPDEWPKTSNGKLRKKDIKALAQAVIDAERKLQEIVERARL